MIYRNQVLLLLVIFVDATQAEEEHGIYRLPPGGRFDPELTMNVPQIIAHWGYPVETHQVTTADGYILELHRIPHGINGAKSNCTRRPVVFMQHGLESGSHDWIINLPDQSPGYFYADAGFDVWLGNFRGNTYGKKHVSMKPFMNAKFWSFSFDEMAEYDLPAMIDFVLAKTGEQQVHYLAHSQGTLAMFAKLAEDQAFGKKLKTFYALAPIGTVTSIKGLIKFASDWLTFPLKFMEDLLGSFEFLPSDIFMQLVADIFCTDPLVKYVCKNVMFLIGGPQTSDNFNTTRSGVYTSHAPSGTSTQNVLHWAQMVKGGMVAKYDYGFWENLKHYGRMSPPVYDYARISGVPIHLYWSDADWLATKTDVQGYILKKLRKDVLVSNNFLPKYNHLDWIWGMRVVEDIHRPIVRKIVDPESGCPL